MWFPLLVPALTVGLAFGYTPSYPHDAHAWAPGGPEDFRGPCPMMNTLANHGFIPRDGRNLTRVNVVKGLGDGLNFSPDLASIMFDQAIIANPEPNATFFTLYEAPFASHSFLCSSANFRGSLDAEKIIADGSLRDQLNVHNLLEHDASLSRSDAYFGNNHVFNQTVFDQTKMYWDAPLIDINRLANAKVARQLTSKAFNPTYTFTLINEEFSLGEVAAPMIAFGDLDALTVNKTLVEYFFENERLPTKFGWKRSESVIALENVSRISEAIRNATKLTTPSAPVLSK
ncbi:heme-thiolate peroxidase [Lasiodiplodia mahajangana]|uniref:Heme-thiolate peroxidase n=1 Tax=Lasiodiplodia mahajangana TaxID=1108764 RepID=A0ACC2JJ70_9PEZI|nr:heme-thiolate peroxidase [Lasiodiplodia mahajangana]